jgi:hypothetical protein
MSVAPIVFVASLATFGSAAHAGGDSTHSYSAEIRCRGEFAPGDVAPVMLRFEELLDHEHTIDVRVEMETPQLTRRTIVSRKFTLLRTERVAFTRSIVLPPVAPPGRYDVWVVADDGDFSVSDTCSFIVR